MPITPTTAGRLPCWVYRSPRKQEMYLFLASQDGFETVPDALMKRFGPPQLVMRLELHADRCLAREDVVTVMANLRHNGFHLQMPPRDLGSALPDYRA